MEPVLEGQWHKIEKDNWREIQRISKDSPWCISNEVYAKDAAEKGPFFYFEVNGVVRVGISTIQHGIHLKKREIRGIDTDQKLDKIVKESKIVENKCRELKLQSLDVKSIEKYLRNWQTVITDQVKLLHLLSFNIKELDDQFEISKDRRREIANNHNAFINYVYNHPELLISIFPNLDLIIDSQESFGTINFSFVENLNQEQIHQLSQLNATVLIHLPEELSSMHIPENIVVISGFLDEFELVLKQSGENMESLPNDTWECNQFDVYKALRRGHLQVRALTLPGNFGNYAFLKKIKVETLILKNLINTYSSITSYDISAKKLIIKDSQLLIDNVEKLELLETHGFRSDSFISINNVDTVIIKDSEFGCKIDDSRKVEIDSSSLVCDIFKTQQVLTTNSSLEGDIFAHHVKLERLKCVRLLIDATSGELNDSEFSENLCLSGPVTCSKVTTSHLEAATMSVEGVSHKSRSFPFIKKSEVSGYLIDATEINSVFNMGQEDEQNIGDKHSINFENELSLIIPVQQSTQLDISILKKYYLGRLTFTGSKTIESLQFGSLEAGIIDLSELESLKGVDFGRIYTNKLILTGLKTIDGITDAFQNMFECDYESDAGIGVIILPKELKHEDFELPFAVENIKYI